MKSHGPLHINVFVEPMFQENAYLLWTDDGPDAWVIDPGLPPQNDDIRAALEKRKLVPRAVVLTHCHADHIAGVAGLLREFPQAELCVPRDEQPMLRDTAANLSAPFGLKIVIPSASRPVAPGEALKLGALKWRALDVAGHSPGGLAYYCRSAGVVFTGDALFAGSIGRYDFPGSSGERLLDNIRRHLLTLPVKTVVYSGHGPATTIEDERETNPYLQEDFVA